MLMAFLWWSDDFLSTQTHQRSHARTPLAIVNIGICKCTLPWQPAATAAAHLSTSRAVAFEFDWMAHLLAATTAAGPRCTALPAATSRTRLPSFANNIKFRLWHKYAPLWALPLRLPALPSGYLYYFSARTFAMFGMFGMFAALFVL